MTVPRGTSVMAAISLSPTKYDSASIAYMVRSSLAGGTAGLAAKTLTAPLDRVKLLLQGGNTSVLEFRGSTSGVFRAIVFIAKRDGLQALWKGHLAMCARIGPYAAINYSCYDQYKRLLSPWISSPALLKLLAGSLAGMTAVTFTYPLDYVRTLLAYQIKTHKYKGILGALRTSYQHDGGTRALYKGYVPTMYGIIPYAGVSFFSYETIKRSLSARVWGDQVAQYTTKSDRSLTMTAQLATGAVAGAVAQTVAYPLDLVRRKYQLYGVATNVPKYCSTSNALSSIFQREGIRGLFLGLSINYLKVAPAMAISFLVYERMRLLLGLPETGTAGGL